MNSNPLNGNNTKVNVPNSIKTPTLRETPLNKKAKKKLKLQRAAKAAKAGLRSKGNENKEKYFGKNWRSLSNKQIAMKTGKKALGVGAKLGVTALGVGAAGFASIAGGDVGKGIQNMTMAGTGAYALGKGIENKIQGIDNKKHFDAMKEEYYGDDYKKMQQEKAEKQFIKNENNLKKIQKTLKVERNEAKEIAKKMAKFTDTDGINDIDTTLAMYQMQQEKDFNEEEIKYAASYNNVALEGKNTNYMKQEDREEYMRRFREKLMDKEGITKKEAHLRTINLFKAMDRYNELKK